MEIKQKPILNMDEALQRNYQLGIIAGMRLAIALPGKLAEIEQEAFTQRLHEERLND